MKLLDMIFTLAFIYLAIFILYFLIVRLSARIKIRRKENRSIHPPGKFIIFIPAFREDRIIIDTVKRCLDHNYPKDRFDVAVVGEEHTLETIAQLNELPVLYFEVCGKKGEAIESVMKELEVDYDFAFVLDADNVMEKDCLWKLNEVLQRGCKAVQGYRKSKNSNTTLSLLDSISEEINHSLFRKGQRALGFSGSLTGSGMAFQYEFFKKVMFDMKGIWEDRELELRIMEEGYAIEYLESAIIYDEKVSTSKVFIRQRAKWLRGQIQYISRTLHYSLFKGRYCADKFNKLLLSFSPPRAILLGTLFFFWTASLLHNFLISPSTWFLALFIYLLVLLFAIPAHLMNRQLMRSLHKIPFVVGLMFVALVYSFVKRKEHYHTPHTIR